VTAEESAMLVVADALEASQIPYFLSGSFASNYYGIPRSTKDADFVLQFHGAVDAGFVMRLGGDFELDPQLSFETITGTYRQLIRKKQTAFTVELFLLSNDPHDQKRFERRRMVQLFDHRIWLPSPEDVIVTKLRWARGKDLEDVKDVIAVRAARLDWEYIESWCKTHGSFNRLENLRVTDSPPK